MIPHGHLTEVAVAVVGVTGAAAALLLQAGSPAGAVDLARSVASSIPDSFWIMAAVIVAVRVVIAGQIKKLVELPPKQVIFEAIEKLEKLVAKFIEDILKLVNANHLAQLEAIKSLQADIEAVKNRVAVIDKARELEAGIDKALKAAKGTQ